MHELDPVEPRLRRLAELKAEAVGAMSMEAPTLGLSIIDGFLAPLAAMHEFARRDAQREAAKEDAAVFSRVIDEYWSPAVDGLKAAARQLGLPGVAVPATDDAIIIFLKILVPKIRAAGLLIDRIDMLQRQGNAALAGLSIPMKHAVFETSIALNNTMMNLAWYPVLRWSGKPINPGEAAMASLMHEALQRVPLLLRKDVPAPQFSEEITVGVSHDDALTALANLSWNAYLHCPEGQLPVPGYLKDSRHVGLYFDDGGSGFSPEARSRCFEPFYRGVDDQESMHRARVGIGLIVARMMGERLGGRLEFGPVGRGERPVLFLPAGPPRSISITS